MEVAASQRHPTLFIAASSMGSPTSVGPETGLVGVISPGSMTPAMGGGVGVSSSCTTTNEWHAARTMAVSSRA